MKDNLERNPKEVKKNAELINETYIKYKEIYEEKLNHFKKSLENIRILREAFDVSSLPEELLNPIKTLCTCSINISKENIEITKELLELLEMANTTAQDVIRLGRFEVNLIDKKA